MNAAAATAVAQVETPTESNAADHARRVAAVESATGTLRMEGLCVSAFGQGLNRGYIAGELSTAGMLEALDRKYKR